MEHLVCQMTTAALGAALSISVGLNVTLARKLTQQGSMIAKLASASALLNEKLIERLSVRDPRYTPKSYSGDSRNPSSDT